MACANGCDHTIFLSEEGILHGFGNNNLGQLGKGDSTPARIPTRILHLPKIKLVSCGAFFTVCADEEGSVWSFGLNFSGQLGTGSTLSYSFNPSKIQDIPPVHSISCGYGHTLMITEDLDLWSFGMNEFGQLFSEEEVKYIAKARRTFYHNVSKISAGGYHSLFQNEKGTIYGCGQNSFGQLGLGIDATKVDPRPILKKSDIIQFFSGARCSLFLDVGGNVFSTGMHDNNGINQISNIPPIQAISCSSSCIFLLDYDENVWSCGRIGVVSLDMGIKKRVRFLQKYHP